MLVVLIFGLMALFICMDIPVAFVCIEQHWMDAVGSNHFDQPILPLDRHFVMSWEQDEVKQ